MSKLVIVESPAKARTIGAYLGPDFVVEASVGHIRDLPNKLDEVPDAYRDQPWVKDFVGVNPDDDFKAIYVVNKDKKDRVRDLKRALKDAEELYLATDEDREGEAIAWHLLETLSPTVPVKRMVFHEITKGAIQAALANPRDLDRQLVDAQEARRILDRLYGYGVSTVLWRKVQARSAGRVQSVATRIVVERERERMAFRSAAWWDLTATLATTAADGPESFEAGLVAIDGQRVATSKDFDESGTLTNADAMVLDEASATSLADQVAQGTARVTSVEVRPTTRRPAPPFTTSTMQQEAGRKLRFGAQRAMRAAQRLYENGYITYMRTDSTSLSDVALDGARRQITERYGAQYVPDEPRRYTSKAKGAQEAHEAIRPSPDDADRFRSPSALKGDLSGDEFALYDLIWKRWIASQMRDAQLERIQARIEVATPDARQVELSATGQTIVFAGFLLAYVEGSDDPEADLGDRETILPAMAEGDSLDVTGASADGHETRPPARYTEASLVKRLEELGIGRPSTYAATVRVIQDRDYVRKQGSALVPTVLAFAVTQLMERYFSHLVDYDFTARMESDLDQIAEGELEYIPWLQKFYFGNGNPGLKALISEERLPEIDAREINAVPIGVDENGVGIELRNGKYGPYLQRGDQTASIPDEVALDELTVARAIEFLERPSDDRELGEDPETGRPVWVRNGRFGPYVQLGDPEEGKPERSSSLFKDMDIDRIDLDTALRLLSLPRTVGQHPEDGNDVQALNGRYGPYVKWGKETRSLDSEDQLFTITLDEALARLKEPKYGARRAQTVLKELGKDPVSGGDMVVRDGRYGPYVTDGEYNASLPKDTTPESLTDERAAELLAERRAKGPAKKARKKKSAKKTTKKTARKTAKKTAKKTARKATGE